MVEKVLQKGSKKAHPSKIVEKLSHILLKNICSHRLVIAAHFSFLSSFQTTINLVQSNGFTST